MIPAEHLSDNPEVHLFGPGPDDARCGMCLHLGALHVPSQEARDHMQTLYFCQPIGKPKKVTWEACSWFIDAGLPGRKEPTDGALEAH